MGKTVNVIDVLHLIACNRYFFVSELQIEVLNRPQYHDPSCDIELKKLRELSSSDNDGDHWNYIIVPMRTISHSECIFTSRCPITYC